jgi:hypothetical protein
MKLDKKMIAVIIIAVFLLIGYLTYPFVVEGLNSASIDTKLSTLQKQLNEEKYKDPTDHVVIGQKVSLIQQGIALLTPVVNNPRFMVKDKKMKYQQILSGWQGQLGPLQQKQKDVKAALDASRKKPTR